MTRSPQGVRAGFAAIAILVFVPLTTLAISALPAAWDHWRYWRAIELPVTDATRLVQVRIADEIFLRSEASLEDLRVINDQGNETP